MKAIQVFIGAGILLFGLSATAQDCYLSSECAGKQICMNTVCSDATEPLEQCTATDDCEYHDICHDGFCKPDGVSCSSETGTAHQSILWSSATCGNGIGTMSMGTADCSAEDGNCDGTTLDELTNEELAKLYDDCIYFLALDCGDAVPVPAEECSTEGLSVCTDIIRLEEQFEIQCEDYWNTLSGEPYEGDSTQSHSTSDADADADVDIDVDYDTGIDSDGYVDESDGTISSSDSTRSEGAFLYKSIPVLTGLADEATPWEIVDCCEDVDDTEDDDRDEIISLLNCLKPLADTDCEGATECYKETFGDDYYYRQPGSFSETGGDADNGDEEADTKAAAGSTGTSDDGSCSMTRTSSPKRSLLSLLF